MALNETLLGRFAADLLTAKSIDERFRLFEKVADQLNFDGLSYTFLPRFELNPVANKMPPLFIKSDSFPDGFIDQYVNGGLSEHDYTVRMISEGVTLPMIWKESEQRDLLSEEEAHVIEIAREDYGISNAFTIPTMPDTTRSLGIGGVSVLSMENDRQFDMLHDNIETLMYCAQIFHQLCFSNLDIHKKFIWPLFEDLDTKERTMLTSLVQGKVVKQIADDFGIVSGSVYRIFDKVRAKAGGVASLQELIHLATIAKLAESS